MGKKIIILMIFVMLLLVGCLNDKKNFIKHDNINKSEIRSLSEKPQPNENIVKPSVEKKDIIKDKTNKNNTGVNNSNENKSVDKPTVNFSYENKIVVLTYHHISPKPFSAITIKPERFEADLKMLEDRGFNVISLRQMFDAIDGKGELPKNAVVITFDDGIESFYKYAFPILKKHNMPAVNFVITSRVEAYKPSKGDFNSLNRNEIAEMYKSGLIDIQSHTHNLHDFVVKNPENKTGGALANRIYYTKTKTYESEEAYVERIKGDLKKSRDLIYEYTGVYPDTICFPFGHYNKKVIDVSRGVGFDYFVTTQIGCNKANSKSKYILRIRSGDAKLDSDKLFKSITSCVKK